MRRIVVAGARGFFGSQVRALLDAIGHRPLAASRGGGGDLRLDVEDRQSIRAALRASDVVIDATGPFQTRTTALLEEAVRVGFDLIDLCDSLAYARRVAAFADAVRDRGIRVFSCCSAVSVLSAFAIRRSGMPEPEAVHGFLAPATRHTANPAVTGSFLSSVGSSINVWRDGAWIRTRGWGNARRFESIERRGREIESADAFTLPRAFPSLRTVDFWVDPNAAGARAMLAVANRLPGAVPLLVHVTRYAAPIVKLAGSREGVLAYEVEGSRPQGRGRPARRDLVAIVFHGPDSHLMAAIPAALAAARLAEGVSTSTGVVPVDRQVPDDSLIDTLGRHGIGISILAGLERRRLE